MTIREPLPDDLAGLKELWQEAFGDPEAFIETFFRTGFARSRCRLVAEDGPVAALYWFDCRWQDRKLAYLYAIATAQAWQGQGLCRRLMEDTHRTLAEKGYVGAVLVPAEAGLFSLYGKMGYRGFSPTQRLTAQAGDEPVAVCRITAGEYAKLRSSLLPPGSVLQDEAALSYLGTYCDFYAGEGFAFSAARDKDDLYIQEYLGDPINIAGILKRLDMKQAHYRRPGGNENLAMYRSFSGEEDCPAYFGIPLD